MFFRQCLFKHPVTPADLLKKNNYYYGIKMLLIPSFNPEWIPLAVMFINGAVEEKQKRVLTVKRNQMQWKEGKKDG